MSSLTVDPDALCWDLLPFDFEVFPDSDDWEEFPFPLGSAGDD